MNYKLKFLPTALKEWKKLDNTIQTQLKKKLKERLKSPHLHGSQLRGFKNHYKIKLRASGYRLVYEVIDDEICVLVIAIGKRNKNEVYKHAKKRAKKKKGLITLQKVGGDLKL
ncbi:MAG: type II toxin-antitoxin system RelE/ParE family toxin [Deltaproteobacteria bacterium]|nr:type II toxin-antitoxin system RelE/ParE family toxin [Deltaproteobacteria bacterium]